MHPRFKKSAHAVLTNGERLIGEIEYLRYENPPHTAHFLVLLAQEELAKAFILALAYRGVIPWSKHLHRATQDHRCKQLLFLVMDHLNPQYEEWSRRGRERMIHKRHVDLPQKIRHAIGILRHEKIGRWESNKWFWAEDPNWDEEALAISNGALDEAKQDSIYVRLGRDGSVVRAPGKKAQFKLEDEVDRAKRMAELVELMIDKEHFSMDWPDTEKIFRILFTETEVEAGSA